MEYHEDIIRLVEELNDEVSKLVGYKNQEEWSLYFSYETIGYIGEVTFGSCQLWNSEEGTTYDEEKDEDEPMDSYLRRRFSEYLKFLGKIKLKQKEK